MMICNNCEFECGYYDESWDDSWYVWECEKGHDINDDIENCCDFKEGI